MELGDFILLVDSRKLAEEDKVELLSDHLLPYLSVLSGTIMQSSGNMKKSFEPVEFAKSIYPSERVWGTEETAEGTAKDYHEERAKLAQRFNLSSEE